MAYDEALAGRVRGLLTGHDGLTERKMFGGIGFMLRGHMCLGVIGEDLVARVDPEDLEVSRLPYARPFTFTGRPMSGFLFVGPGATADGAGLRAWVERCTTFCASLPPKRPRERPRG
jgi:hypothetical protein